MRTRVGELSWGNGFALPSYPASNEILCPQDLWISVWMLLLCLGPRQLVMVTTANH